MGSDKLGGYQFPKPLTDSACSYLLIAATGVSRSTRINWNSIDITASVLNAVGVIRSTVVKGIRHLCGHVLFIIAGFKVCRCLSG